MSDKLFFQHVQSNLAYYLGRRLKLVLNVHYRGEWVGNGPRMLSIGISIDPQLIKDVAKLDEELAAALQLDQDAFVRIYRGNRGILILEIPKPKALWKTLPMSELPKRRGLRVAVGYDGRKKPADVNFADPLTPHLLLAGATGSGKTNCLRLLAYDLISQNEPDRVGLILIDVKKRGANWRPFANCPHLLHPVIESDAIALRALSWAIAEFDRRSQSGRKKPDIFIGIDESQELLDRPEFVRAIGNVAATGREFGIHLLAACQNPTKSQLGDVAIKRNLTCRLVGRTDSAISAVVASGQEKSGAEKLTGSGDFLLVNPMGVKRLTAAMLTDSDTVNLPRTENVNELDLGEYGDPDHVADMARRKPDPLESHHVAVALVHPMGINRLAKLLRIGNTKAGRIKKFADDLRRDLGWLGYGVSSHTSKIIPVSGRYATD